MTTTTDTSTDLNAIAFAVLRIAGELPGRVGRTRAARIIGGYPTALRESESEQQFARYTLTSCAPHLRAIVDVIDAMVTGGLVALSDSPRPLLVLTRAGHRALDALEATT